MPQAKTRSKIQKKPASPRVESHEEETTDSDVASFLGKGPKKDPVIEDDEILPLADKLEEVAAIPETAADEEAAEEEVSLDDEEINPFGDKWEE